jgi:uncharacterized protein involved in type VI secretion and phage assembly
LTASELASEEPALEFEKIINQPALLTLHGRDEPRYVHAMIGHLEQGNEGERFTIYYATIVPRVWYLRLKPQPYGCRE